MLIGLFCQDHFLRLGAYRCSHRAHCLRHAYEYHADHTSVKIQISVGKSKISTRGSAWNDPACASPLGSERNVAIIGMKRVEARTRLYPPTRNGRHSIQSAFDQPEIMHTGSQEEDEMMQHVIFYQNGVSDLGGCDRLDSRWAKDGHKSWRSTLLLLLAL